MSRYYIISSLIFLISRFTLFAQPITGKHTFANSSKLAEGIWHKIAVENNDVYQITYNQLRSWGFSDPSKVAVYGFGGNIINESFNTPHIDDLPEVAVFHDAVNSRILFYGKGVIKWSYSGTLNFYHENNFYATQGYYFLHQKSDAPVSMQQINTSSDSYYSFATSTYNDYFLHEKDLENLGNTGREMYGESFNYTRTRDFDFNIPGLVDTVGKINVNFIANNSIAGTLTGTVNGVQFISSSVSAIGSDKYQFARTLNSNMSYNFDGGTTQKVRLTYNPNSGTLKSANLNYIRLNVTRELQPYSGSTLFRVIGNGTSNEKVRFEIPLTSFSADLMVWNVSDITDIKSHNLVNENDKLYFVGNSLTEYALVNTRGSFSGVTYCGKVENQNLHSLIQTDMVIISPEKFIDQANRLASFRRENDGLSVHVVTPAQIYNEFSSGTPDATAYRLFMKMFYDRSVELGTPPSYLLLMGDGACDNRGMNSANWSSSVLENCLLTYQSVPTLNETESYVCDDYFGFLDDDEGGKTDVYGQITLRNEGLDIGIGRFPVRTVTQAKNMVDKVIAYSLNNEYGVWKNNLVFLGDDGDNSTHMKHADAMVNIIEGQNLYEFNFTKKIGIASCRERVCQYGQILVVVVRRSNKVVCGIMANTSVSYMA